MRVCSLGKGWKGFKIRRVKDVLVYELDLEELASEVETEGWFGRENGVNG